MQPTSRQVRLALIALALLCLAQWPPARAQTAPARRATALVAPRPTALSASPAAPRPRIRFTTPNAAVAAAPHVATISMPFAGTTLSIPYIQTQPDLKFALDVEDVPPGDEVWVTLDPRTPSATTQVFDSAPFAGTFPNLAYGEHVLAAAVVDPVANRGAGRPLASTWLRQVARGSIVAALGDSTTEGLGGPVVGSYGDWLQARRAVPQYVSQDGRNFPQPGQVEHPKAHVSFTVELGELLSQAWGHPVFVLNLGWSGITADGFAHVADSGYLRNMLGIATPDNYVVNLGVNDALVGRPPAEFEARLQSIVASLERNFGASPAEIHIACPSWSAQPARQALEVAYKPYLEQLRGSLGLPSAPDFFDYYGSHRDQVADKVHPNSSGYSAMAQLWAAALMGQSFSC